MMNVLHISLSDVIGGASIAAYRQHRALIQQGINSRMLVAFKESHDHTVELYQRPQQMIKKAHRYFDRMRITCRKHKLLKMGQVFSQAFSFPDSDMPFKWGEISRDTTVVNIHMSAGFIDLESFLPSIPSDIPVVFTMHDMNAFTGGCHYTFECEAFTRGCGNCPMLQSPKPNDFSSRNFQLKKRVYGLRPQGKTFFVGDSQWIIQEAARSGLLKDMNLKVIHYGVDVNLYHPIDKVLAKTALGIPEKVKTILFVSENLNDPRKGFQYLLDALAAIEEPENVMLLSVGRNPPSQISNLSALHFGMLQNQQLLALIYNAADIFVAPSVYEAFGQTALEAQSCGIPVVAFNTGGLRDIVIDGETGFLCEWKSVSSMRAGINRLLTSGDLRCQFGKNARVMTENKFSMETNAHAYITLYRELMDTSLNG